MAWSEVDRGLAEGLLTYEASLNEVGIPSWIAQDPTREWVVDEMNDGSLAVLDEARADAQKTPLGHGVRLTVIPRTGPAPAPQVDDD